MLSRAAARGDHSSFFVSLPFPLSNRVYCIRSFLMLLLVTFDSLFVDLTGHKKTPMAEPTGVSRKAQCKPSSYWGITYICLIANFGPTNPCSAVDTIAREALLSRSRVFVMWFLIGRAIYQLGDKCQLQAMSDAFQRYATRHAANLLYQASCKTKFQTSRVEYVQLVNGRKWNRLL